MKLICSIDLIAPLLAKDLPQRNKMASVTLFYFDLYQGALLGTNTFQRLRDHLREGDLVEIAFSEEEMQRYHQGFADSEQHLYLTIQDYVAVEYAKEQGWRLLADKGCLSRYAISRGVAVMSLKELEHHYNQRRRLDGQRKAQLTQYFAKGEDENTIEMKPVQQPIDDETTV